MSNRPLERRLRALRDPAGPPPGLADRLIADIPDEAAPARPSRAASPWALGRLPAPLRLAAVATTLAAAVLLLAPLFHSDAPPAGLEALLAPVARASAEADAVHLVFRTRMRPGEDFDFVNVGGDLERVEGWIRWPRDGEPGRLRMEKTDRAYAFDGTEELYYIRNVNEVWREAGRTPRYSLLWPAAWLEHILEMPEGAQIVEQEEGRLHLRWSAPDLAGRSPAFFDEFDREVEIRWDPASRRLTGFTRWVQAGGQRLLFSEIDSIDYPPFLDDSIFRLDLPADVRMAELVAAPSWVDQLAPREAAERFWRAVIAGDWATAAWFCPSPSNRDWLAQYRPIELRRLGEPFESGNYPGVFIPYEMQYARDRLPRSGNLAMRRDNRFHRWVVDGGL